MRDPDTDRLRLLVVEDEYVPALYLSDVLEELGAEVLGPVATVNDALRLMEQAPEIDAAILDVGLGGEAVFPLADALLARHVPFAFASGYDPDLMPPRFRDVALCQKPIDEQAVRAMLARLRHAA